MAQSVLFSGNSLQQAVLAAARHFHLDADEVSFRVREQRQGIVRGRQRVVIEVDPSAPRAIPQATAVVPAAAVASPSPARARETAPMRPRAERHPRAEEGPREPRRAAPLLDAATRASLPVASGPEAEATLTALQHLSSLAGLAVAARVLQGPQALWVDLGGDQRAALVAEDAQLLEAIEQLLPRVVRGLYGGPVALEIDAGGVRERLVEDLRQLALAAAGRVATSGSPETLREMNPAERRIVHLTLAEHVAVATESLGSGVMKRIQVRPR